MEAASEIQIGRDNERQTIILKNPTNQKRGASVVLCGCLQPEYSSYDKNGIRVFKNITGTAINLGTHKLQPHTCTRIKRDSSGGIMIGEGEANAVCRVRSKEDFKLSEQTGEPVCGLLKISVAGGSIFNPEEPGLEQADSALFYRYKDFVPCEGKDCGCKKWLS